MFLQSLVKSNDATNVTKFDHIQDYPRKDLPKFLKQIKESEKYTEKVTKLTYRLTDAEVSEMNVKVGTKVPTKFVFSTNHYYNNQWDLNISVDVSSVLSSLQKTPGLSTDLITALKKVTKFRNIPTMVKEFALSDADKSFLADIEKRVGASPWDSVISFEAWSFLKTKLPKFLYFSDYDLLPSKMNLNDLANKVEQAKNDPSILKPEHRAVLALLRMADISLSDFTKTGGYEELKAKIEGVSISITDQIMEFWKQNEDLEVEVDIKPDQSDSVPFNNGANLYLRIKNRRHRGVSTPFQHRSRGFIWFFSFLVWFDSVQHQTGSETKNLILLLDEPALALHALAQADFLRYIDKLSEKHQVIYTTHSPFMVHSNRLDQVRVVEDKLNEGTTIEENISSSNQRTISPLQAALGWSIAQNLFIAEKNLLVEGPSDLIYLKALSAALQAEGKAGLDDTTTIVPVGGLDKVATFIALLGANGLKLAVLHDFKGSPEQKLDDMVKNRLISEKNILNASQFRELKAIGKNSIPSDLEDLFSPAEYIEYFNLAFPAAMKKKSIKLKDLEAGDRIIARIERLLKKNEILLRPSGGFNHYSVATAFINKSPKTFEPETLVRFEALFTTINKALT